MATRTTPKPAAILRLRDVIKITGLARSTIYRLDSQGAFPRRVHLGIHSVGWYAEEVSTWLESRQRA
jgi:prophage regulatory protein